MVRKACAKSIHWHRSVLYIYDRASDVSHPTKSRYDIVGGIIVQFDHYVVEIKSIQCRLILYAVHKLPTDELLRRAGTF